MPKHSHAVAAGCLLYALTQSVSAQVVPDAGSLQREIDRNLRAPSAPHKLAPLAPATEAPTDGPVVTVRSFVIEGAQLLAEHSLQDALAPFVGRPLTMAQLQQATATVQHFYRSQGWYAQAILPPQDITEGIVRIQVVEGHWGQSHLVPPPAGHALRADAQAVENLITSRLQPGQPLSSADLERGLLLANDLPGIQATGVLQAGQAVGTTDMHIRVQDTPWISGDVELSNYGLRYTGKAQLSGGIALNNLSGRGDQLALRLLGAAHLGSMLARYSLPLGHDGLRLSGWASTLRYRLAGNYEPLQAKGSATNYGIALSYPILRQERRNLSLDTGWQQRHFDDDMLQEPMRRQRVHAWNLGLQGNMTDGIGHGAYTWSSVRWSTGRNRITDINGAAAVDAAGPRTQGNFHKLNWQLARLQNLGTMWQVLASASGQWSNKNLASSERMTLGGPDQVRAYPINEAAGDQGVVLKLQLQRYVAPGWQAQLFYDWGSIRQYHRTWNGWNAASAQPNRYRLAGWGIGLNWQGQGDLRAWGVQASIATPTGSNAGHTLHRNSDGSSLRSTRGWLTLNYRF